MPSFVFLPYKLPWQAMGPKETILWGVSGCGDSGGPPLPLHQDTGNLLAGALLGDIVEILDTRVWQRENKGCLHSLMVNLGAWLDG